MTRSASTQTKLNQFKKTTSSWVANLGLIYLVLLIKRFKQGADKFTIISLVQFIAIAVLVFICKS
jgi:hypothetical protein